MLTSTQSAVRHGCLPAAQMSERLQELERAIAVGATAAGGPAAGGPEDPSAHSGGSTGECSARASEAGSAVPMGRALSAGLVRMGSASVRRTLGSFRWGVWEPFWFFGSARVCFAGACRAGMGEKGFCSSAWRNPAHCQKGCRGC